MRNQEVAPLSPRRRRKPRRSLMWTPYSGAYCRGCTRLSDITPRVFDRGGGYIIIIELRGKVRLASLLLFLFCFWQTKRTISSNSEGWANLICFCLSRCNRLCHGFNLLLLVLATCKQQRPRRGTAQSPSMSQRQLNTLVCAHTMVSEVLSRGQTSLIEMSILKPPKFSIHTPATPPSGNQDASRLSKAFSTKLRRG